MDAKCDEISEIFIQYKLTFADIFEITNIEIEPPARPTNRLIMSSTKQQVITPTQPGEYQIQMVVRNNEGIESKSELITITLMGKYKLFIY